MGFWHTGVPNGGEPLGWLGRLADGAYDHDAQGNMIVNIGTRQSLAVQARHHQPLVFNNPRSFRRVGTETEQQAIERLRPTAADNPPSSSWRRRRPTPSRARSSSARRPPRTAPPSTTASAASRRSSGRWRR